MDVASPNSDPPSSLQRGQLWLESVLHLMGLTAVVTIVDDRLEIDSASLTEQQQQVLLSPIPATGHTDPAEDSTVDAVGVVLDALQYLANTELNLHQEESEQRSYTIDLAGYRQQRWVLLQELTLTAVSQVRQTQGEYEFGALSAAERRQVHLFLEADAYKDLESFSRGKEPDRRLVIRPVKVSLPKILDPL